MGRPAGVHLQVLAGRHEDVVVVVGVPDLVVPSGAYPAGVVGIAVGVDLRAVVQPGVGRWEVYVVGRVHTRAAVVVRSAGLVVRRDHRHRNLVWAATHRVVHADEGGAAAVRVHQGAGQLPLHLTVARVAPRVEVGGGGLLGQQVQVEPVLLGERQRDREGVVGRDVHLVVVVPVPAVVRPAGEGLVHRLYAEGVVPLGAVARVLAEAGVVRVRALWRLNGLVVYREGQRVVHLPVHGDGPRLHLQHRHGLLAKSGVPCVGVVGRERVRVAVCARAAVDVRLVADVHVHVEPEVVVRRTSVGGVPVESGPDAVVGGDRYRVPVLRVVASADHPRDCDLLAGHGKRSDVGASIGPDVVGVAAGTRVVLHPAGWVFRRSQLQVQRVSRSGVSTAPRPELDADEDGLAAVGGAEVDVLRLVVPRVVDQPGHVGVGVGVQVEVRVGFPVEGDVGCETVRYHDHPFVGQVIGAHES